MVFVVEIDGRGVLLADGDRAHWCAPSGGRSQVSRHTTKPAPTSRGRSSRRRRESHSRTGRPCATPPSSPEARGTVRALTTEIGVCDTADMSETLTIRVAAEEKARWEKAAAAARESVAEYVRVAVRQRAQAASQSPWERHLGSANVAVPAPTNANIRRAFARGRRHKG